MCTLELVAINRRGASEIEGEKPARAYATGDNVRKRISAAYRRRQKASTPISAKSLIYLDSGWRGEADMKTHGYVLCILIRGEIGGVLIVS